MYKTSLKKMTDGELIHRWYFERRKEPQARSRVLMVEICEVLCDRVPNMTDGVYERFAALASEHAAIWSNGEWIK